MTKNYSGELKVSIKNNWTDYQNYLFANTSSISGKITIAQGTRKISGSNVGDIYGATWFSTAQGKFVSQPNKGVTSLYYDRTNNDIGIDLSDLFQTLRAKYGTETKEQVFDKPITLMVNGKSIELKWGTFTPKDNLTSQGYPDATNQYTFHTDYGVGDLLNISGLIGQSVDFSISW